MKLRTPFSIVVHPVKDTEHIHDLSCKLTNKKLSEFWEHECKLSPTKSSCKLYEV